VQRLTVRKEHPLTETRSLQADAVVIGGGMAGLTAACYLARAGVGVTLFEKAPYLGGRAATWEFDGFLFNRGGHALYTGGAASQVFEELGIAYDYGIPKGTFVLQGASRAPSQRTRSGSCAPKCWTRQTSWRSYVSSSRWAQPNRAP
jgi:glycine/D-amino acid oxidase-like deaminating enzyme